VRVKEHLRYFFWGGCFEGAFAVMSHTPPRTKTGFSPPEKKTKSLNASFDRAEQALQDLATKIAEDAGAQGDSPSSTHSEASVKSEMATEIDEMATKVKGFRNRLDEEEDKVMTKEATEYAEKEQECVNTITEIDGSSLLLFDDPHGWDDEKIRESYQKHRKHNIANVRDRFKDDITSVPISEKQRGDYFSRAALGIAIAHYPPSSQCGTETNVAIEVHRNATKKNGGNQILRLKSLCMQTHAFLAGVMGVDDFDKDDDNYAFNYVEYYDDADVKRNARVTLSTRTFLEQHDFVERHPTFDDNKVNVEKIIDLKIGMDYRVKGDELFAEFIKCRRAYILNRSGANIMGSPTKAPVIVWNAGRVKRDSERTGAQAALVETLVQKGINDQLFGIFHPEYLMRRENPVVQVAAQETDLEICRFIEASGGVVRVDDVVRKFVGVAECTPKELDRMARELSDYMSALGMFSWTSKGRPGSVKNKYYLHFFEKTEDETLSAKLAQTQVMFDGALEAAARFAGLTADKVMELDEEGVQDLIEAHRYDGLLRAAARFRNISWDKVEEGMTKNEVDGMVRAYIRAGQLTAAAKFRDISEQELEEMNETEKDALIGNHIRDTSRAGQLTAAAKFHDISEQELEERDEKDKDALIEKHRYAGQLTAAAKFLDISEDELAFMDDTQKRNSIASHLHQKKIEAAAAAKCIPQNVLEGMTKKKLDVLINDHQFDGKVGAAISWARKKQKASDTSSSTSLSLVASQHCTAVDHFLSLPDVDAELENMSQDEKNELFKDLVEEHKHLSMLEKACVTLGENFDEAKGESWTPKERRDVIETYKLLRRAESLGYSSEAVKGMTPEMRREVKHTYNKKLLLSKLGIEANDGSHDDGDDGDDGDGDDTVDGKKNLTYAEGMEMTIEDIQTLIAKLEGGGKTTEQAIRETFALALGLTEDLIKGLSPVDLDKIRVIRLQKGIQKKNIERGVFHLPGTSEHANVVEDICVSLRAYGLRILSEAIERAHFLFLNDWAFRIFHDEDTKVYNVYKRVVFHGIEYYERVLDAALCIGAKKYWSKSKSRLAAITKYIYREREEFFQDAAIGRDTLANLLAKVDLNSQQLAERTKLQKKIEQNKDGLFKFAGDDFFESFLKQLASEFTTATFHRSLEKNKETRPWWYKRVCLQRVFSIRKETGRERTTDCLYYQDDSGSWLGANIQWDIVPGKKERTKTSHVAIVEILNALDERFENVPVASDGGEEENEEGARK